jgi:hypothetical protein
MHTPPLEHVETHNTLLPVIIMQMRSLQKSLFLELRGHLQRKLLQSIRGASALQFCLGGSGSTPWQPEEGCREQRQGPTKGGAHGHRTENVQSMGGHSTERCGKSGAFRPHLAETSMFLTLKELCFQCLK